MRRIKKIVGICGGTGTGKTTMKSFLKEKLPSSSFISLDDYYLPITEQAVDQNGKKNFDLPTAINWTRLENDIQSLLSGKSFYLDEYTFNNPHTTPKRKRILVRDYLFVEGLFIWSSDQIKDLLDYTVYLDVPSVERQYIKQARDILLRGMSQSDFEYQWQNQSLVAERTHIEPVKEQADIVINGLSYQDQMRLLEWLKSKGIR